MLFWPRVSVLVRFLLESPITRFFEVCGLNLWV
nr:MAG TPA: hypothetical protein [Caudoviricetes sp.]